MFSEILESRIAMPGKWETRLFNAKHALYSAFLTISLCAFFFIFNWIQVNLFSYTCNTKCILFVVNTSRLAHNVTHSRVLLFNASFLVQFSLFFVTFTRICECKHIISLPLCYLLCEYCERRLDWFGCVILVFVTKLMYLSVLQSLQFNLFISINWNSIHSVNILNGEIHFENFVWIKAKITRQVTDIHCIDLEPVKFNCNLNGFL